MIEFLETHISVALAVAVYMVAFVLASAFLIPWLSRKAGKKIDGGKALMLTWAIGALLFAILALVGCYAVTWSSAFLFVIVTGLCNSAYKWTRLKDLVRPVRQLGE